MDQLKKLLDYLEPKFKKINLLLWMIVGLLLSIAIGTLSFLHTAYSLLPTP
jgi:cytochrome c-type biogenesis protein CcmH/NrfF|tara:strand:+ start:151 stop:303 length:153 start_codon:yes stop_codon:yes gene_type:complete